MSGHPSFSVLPSHHGPPRIVVRYHERLAALELDGKPTTVEAEALSMWFLETQQDGTMLVSFVIERANAFRGCWVAALSWVAGSARLVVEETLRLSRGTFSWNTEETWFALDGGPHSPRLERARWLLHAKRHDGKPWIQPVSAKDLRALGVALERCGDAWIRLAYGRALNALKQHAEALAVLEGHPLDRARALLGLERYAEVLQAIDEVPMASHESVARAHWLRGKALVGLGRDAEAMISLLAALSSDDLNSYELGARHDDLPAAAHRSVAVEGFRMGRFEDALQGYAGLLLKGGASRRRETSTNKHAHFSPQSPSPRSSRLRKRQRSLHPRQAQSRLHSISATTSRTRSWAKER